MYCTYIVCLWLQTKSYQNDQINKQTDQMFVLLAMCLVLHPQRIDESIHTTLRSPRLFLLAFSELRCTDESFGIKCVLSGCFSGCVMHQNVSLVRRSLHWH